MEYIYKTPIDEHTCEFCKARDGKRAVLISDAANVQEGCTNRSEDGKESACRCYVAKKTKTVLQFPGDPDIEMKEVTNDSHTKS